MIYGSGPCTIRRRIGKYEMKGTARSMRYILITILTVAATAFAQPQPDNSNQTEQYRIGPHDILTIRVTAGRAVPELSMDAVEVSECGQIPLLSVQQEDQNEIRAAGLTRQELAEQLRSFYTKYKRNPQVDAIAN